ncbi:MAG: hypothetical protein IPJ89_02860 [Candidatus Iainarchaeum archaeon]|uniref:Glycosyltransferase RgtA/B/C/D-like domain-containing protein n=1 Tax=Candidatus Iainarchaeum sp. TaxID=3101447 RepID=A0A7T9DKT0_9ARCH|nr:MAG: hypothetical protein IPJ89_02860 [Candidatus Diapherotrites archaeon]
MHPILRHDCFPLGCAIIVSALLFFSFFPLMYVSIDEHQYYKNSILLQRGELKSADPLVYCGGTFKGEDYLSSYHIGKSVALIPFTWLPFPFVMLAGLFIHLLNTGIFALILRKLRLSPWFVMLFAFYPAFIWGSRTLFSETTALTFLLVGTWIYLHEKPQTKLFAGFFFGLAALVRHEAVLLALAFGIAIVWKERHTLREPLKSPIVWFVIGGAISAALLLGWNNWYGGNPLTTQIGNPANLFATFPRPLFLNNLVNFFAILCIAFPLLIFALLKPFRLRLELIIASIFTLFLFAQTTNISVYPFISPLTITARMRYLIPLAGLLLIAYAHALQPITQRFAQRIGKTKWVTVLVLFVILIVGAIALHSQHQSLLDKRTAVRNQILTAIPDNAHAIGSSDDCIYFLPQLSGKRTYSKVDDPAQSLNQLQKRLETPIYVVALQYTNQSDSSIRQDVIDRERMAIVNFVKAHENELQVVYSTKDPHSLTIYHFNHQINPIVDQTISKEKKNE